MLYPGSGYPGLYFPGLGVGTPVLPEIVDFEVDLSLVAERTVSMVTSLVPIVTLCRRQAATVQVRHTFDDDLVLVGSRTFEVDR